MERKTKKRIVAVLAGIFAGAILSLLTDEFLHLVHVFPPWGQPAPDNPLLLATAYRVVYSTFGCYLAARLAPDRPMLHALAVGFVGLVLSIVGAVITWNTNVGPHWYSVAVAAIAMPCAWAGGSYRALQLHGR